MSKLRRKIICFAILKLLGENLTEIPQETLIFLGVFTITQLMPYERKIEAKFKVSVLERKTANILNTPFSTKKRFTHIIILSKRLKGVYDIF